VTSHVWTTPWITTRRCPLDTFRLKPSLF